MPQDALKFNVPIDTRPLPDPVQNVFDGFGGTRHTHCTENIWLATTLIQPGRT
jgi:hypothetical protein